MMQRSLIPIPPTMEQVSSHDSLSFIPCPLLLERHSAGTG